MCATCREHDRRWIVTQGRKTIDAGWVRANLCESGGCVLPVGHDGPHYDPDPSYA